jgi:putative N6-adenine-specific DNA methylase/tRNA (guanine6-N2)-methyltransferase
MLFGTVNGLEKLASGELADKLGANKLELFPYGSRGWIRCEMERSSIEAVRRLRSITEAHIVLREEKYGAGFSIDGFADMTVEAISAFAPEARRISVSAYSVRGRPSQRQIQGAFSRRIVERLHAQSSFKDYDTVLRITLLKSVAVATIKLDIQPGNFSKKVDMHPTPLLPPIAYCMIRLCIPQAGERLLDPMCGCGTIPMMAAIEWNRLSVVGADIEQEYVSCAKKNAITLGLQNKTEFFVSDIAELADRGIEADIIAVNPPFGIAIPSGEKVDKLYRTLFETASMILSSRGRMVTVTPYSEIVEREVIRQKLKIGEVYRLLEGELPRTIHLIMRRV